MLEQEHEQFEDGKELILRETDDDGRSNIKGGTLEKLVQKLTYHKMPSADFTSAFLLTYRSFTKPKELLQLLIKRYDVEVPSFLTEEQRAIYVTRKMIPVRLR